MRLHRVAATLLLAAPAPSIVGGSSDGFHFHPVVVHGDPVFVLAWQPVAHAVAVVR